MEKNRKLSKGNSKNLVNLTLSTAIVLVIVILILYWFALMHPLFSDSVVNPQCVAKPGYLCQTPIYVHTNSGILVVLGQNTGKSWTGANFVFVPQGTNLSNEIPDISFISYPANTVYAKNGTKSGETLDIWLPVNGVTPPVDIGTTATGSIWVQYTTNSNQAPQYAQIATINIKAS